MKAKRKVYDIILESITYFASFLSVLILGAIIIFVVSKGAKGINLNFITGSSNEENYILYSEVVNSDNLFVNKNNYEYFSEKLGIAIKESENYNKDKVIEIIYIDSKSPIKNLKSKYHKNITLEKGFYFDTYFSYTNELNEISYVYATDSPSVIINNLNLVNKIESFNISKGGGGILSSIITTLILVVLTLLIGFPLGIITALYLHELAPSNRLINLLRTLIDMLTGVPSIIYGLVGVSLLIPFSQRLLNNPNALGGNILAGSLTLSIMVLPVVIKATESALNIVPKDYKQASLALGANEIQTAFLVVLPSALPGILSAALLTIGRVIGESAALIYVIGTVVSDQISLGGKGTSLAVHIWSLMAGENPNIEMAASVGIIILVLVLSLNLVIKFISNRLDRKFRG